MEKLCSSPVFLLLVAVLSLALGTRVQGAKLDRHEVCELINNYTSDKDLEVFCSSETMPMGTMIKLYEDDAADADYSKCESFILLPGENLWSRSARGGLYLFALLYTFLGIAIVADIFMNAIEVITSEEKEVMQMNEATGKAEAKKEKVWNDTVANLSLMALGSSAPEILLSVIGVFPLGEEADALGPGTIVGSAAFNLLFITAICVVSPCPRCSSIHQFGVFCITAFFSVEAYLWLLFIIEFSTPEIIDLWEALVTFFHFPLLIILAYGQDRSWDFKKVGRVSPEEVDEDGNVKPHQVRSKAAYRREAMRGLTAGKREKASDADGKLADIEEAESKPTAGATSDPYCIVRIGNKTFKTPWLKKNLNPRWDKSFSFEDVKESDTLLIEVMDHDELSADDFMGQAKVSLQGLETDKAMDMWIELLNKHNVPDGRGCVKLVLTIVNQSGALNLQCEVCEGRDLIGLEQSNKYVDAMASSLGNRVRAGKAWFSRHKDVWQSMKVDWFDQFHNALTACGDKDEDGNDLPPSSFDLTMHFLTVFWKCFFALIPPPNYYGGWLAFFVALIFIGMITAIVGELASLFGCVVGLKDAVTAITFVALGTSLPDTFASRVAAMSEEVADSAIGNVTGSNGVNVFLGIGIPWTICALYAEFNDPFVARSCGFGLSVFVYCICATMCLATLVARRKMCGGELGGNPSSAKLHAAFFVVMWLIYIVVSSLRSYDKIGNIWAYTSDAPDGSDSDMCA